MVSRYLFLTGLIAAMSAAPALAQGRTEVSVNFGWTFSDGVDGNSILAGDGHVYNRVDPKDSASFGFGAGFMVTDNAEVGFMWSRQFSNLVIGGTQDRELGDLAIDGYHGYYAYNFGDADAKVRPFLYGGLGATHFGGVDAQIAGVNRSIGSETQFSTTWGGGVKFYPAPAFGIKAVASWSPTYIKSDAEGWWCDPYWGCYLVGSAQYSNQLTLSGGVTFRF